MNQTDYPCRMYLKQLPISMLMVCLLFAAPVRAQDNPSDNADLKEFLKQVAEMQKKATGSQTQNVPAFDVDKKLAEIEAATKEAARRQQEEQRDQEKLQVALEKQLAAPGPVTLPDWMPAIPQFKAVGSPTKKIAGNEVRIVQTGTSSITPEELADAWESAAEAKNLNHARNNIDANGKLMTVTSLSTRSDPVQEVKLEASREADGKITQIEISSPLPKPDIGRE